MKKGEILTVEVERFADQGKALARVEGRVVFFTGAAPGDLAEIMVTKVKKSFAEARLKRIVQPSDLRVAPRCPYFGVCGGCKWQHVRYEAQTEAKRESVEDALVHHGGFSAAQARPTMGMETPWYYRNKMEFSFSNQRWLTDEDLKSELEFDRSFGFGLHVPGRFDKILDIETCFLQSKQSEAIVNATRRFARANDWAPWDTRNHVGFLRHLVIRQSHHMPDLMLNLVTNGYDETRMQAYAAMIQSEFPDVTTLVNTINTGLAQTAYGEEIITILGSGKIYDKIGDLTFEVAPNAFFQTNTAQAERLYEVTRAFGELKPDDLLYDLYCGAGTISLFCAPYVRHVVGVELVPEAIENARTNAELNGLSNTTFLSGDLMRLFTPEFVQKHGRPDVLIVDPPRAGMHPKVVEQIAQLRPERFVYVSCNPMTQARDLKLLADIYDIEAVQPVDMFPHTHHIESVVKLRLRTAIPNPTPSV